MHTSTALVSIIVPTYQEVLNLPHLVPRISAAMTNAGLDFEIVVVDDDSGDGSEECVKQLQEEEHHPIRIMIRKKKRGLSSAVIHGFCHARGDFLVCMDADLSHPPEQLPALIRALGNPEIDFVIGSRYAEEDSTAEDWSAGRRLNSWIATQLARPFTRAKDPMAGFNDKKFLLHVSHRETQKLGQPAACRPALENLKKAAESTDWPPPNLAGTISANGVLCQLRRGLRARLDICPPIGV